MEMTDDAIWQVVVNHEEQYSVVLADAPIPHGWRAIGPRGPKPECLEYVKTAWTDMRPASLRSGMDGERR